MKQIYLNPLDETLIEAIKDKDSYAVAGLIKKGANPNVRLEKSITPLMMAAASGDLPTLAQLFYGGADLEAEDDVGNDAAIYAALGRYKTITTWIVRLRDSKNFGPRIGYWYHYCTKILPMICKYKLKKAA